MKILIFFIYLKELKEKTGISWVVLTSVFYCLIFLFGCANQQPPGGGDEDKVPPKVKIITPKPNSTNFKGNSVTFEFNEYVDRRSFQDAFRISPSIKGDLEFDWGQKDVEVIFPQNLSTLDPNKTYVININSSLKDIRGNPITVPVTFAFSTGPKIDMAEVNGKVYNAAGKTASILAYNLAKSYEPKKNLPDYLTETAGDGTYSLTNLSPGEYRIITIIDDDRNLLFTTDRESYGVLPYDVTIKDSIVLNNVNFLLRNIDSVTMEHPEEDYTKYFKDSLNIVYSSVENDSRTVLPEQSIFLFFNRFRPAREDFVSSFKITDENGTPLRVVYNWRNDSLVEVFASEKFATNRKYSLSFNLKTLNDSLYTYSLGFRTASANSFGELKGSIRTNYEVNIFDFPIKIDIFSTKMPGVRYSYEVRDSVFSFKELLEAEYGLFSFVDMNSNSTYDYGNPYPFVYSEPFYFYPQPLNIKGGWTVENVVINFIK